jgi:hypothetical protein
LTGITWQGCGLIALLYGLWTLHWILAPRRMILTHAEVLSAWLGFWASMLVGGICLYLLVVILLNAAASAGHTRAWIIAPVAAAGCLVVAMITGLVGSAPTGLVRGETGFVAGALFWADWATAMAVGYLVLMRVRKTRAATLELELQRKAQDTRRLQGRLRVLQAQIEPHFLFNTLSNIRRLCQKNVASSRDMLAQLTLYLHAALPKIRRDLVPLADEIELVRAYLALQQIRMGDRLQVLIVVPDDCLGQPIPPMLLVTLAENAIKHGLAPLPEGGKIDIRARVEDDAMTITVADTGQGFVAQSGKGVGLTNLRAQLEALYGQRAMLTLQAQQPHGVRASITLPCTAKEPGP